MYSKCIRFKNMEMVVNNLGYRINSFTGKTMENTVCYALDNTPFNNKISLLKNVFYKT